MQGRGQGYGGGGLQFGPPITPPIVKQLLIANGVVFFLQRVSPALGEFGAIRPDRVLQEGWLWQPFTYMWLHGGLAHVGFNMLALWMFGSPMALAWGPRRFLRFYLMCGVGAGLVIAGWPYVAVGLGQSPAILGYSTLGASGAVFGVLLAYSITWPDRYIMLLFPPIPIKAIYFIPFLLVMEYANPGQANVSHVGHLGGVLVGWILLSRDGRTQGLLSLGKLKHRWRRWRMRQRLQAVRSEERRWQEQRRDRGGPGSTLH